MRALLFCLAAAIALAGCGGHDSGSASATPTASRTAAATTTTSATASVTAPPPTSSPTQGASRPPTASATISPTATPTAIAATPTPTVVRQPIIVRLVQPLGPVTRELLGVGWNTGRLETIEPFGPPSVRIDADLPLLSSGPGDLRLGALRDKVAAVRALGAEPLVILFRMPEWLGAPTAAQCVAPPLVGGPCNPQLVAPADLDAWENLIADVVRGLATDPRPALRFESWNEPDLFIFWHDSPEAFFRTAVRTHRAVARVAAETGLPIEIGGPGASLSSFGPGLPFIPRYVAAISAAGVPLHFVSWHWYANYPFLGPDGNEGQIPDVIYEMIGRVNPDATPRSYAQLTAEIRAAISAVLPTDGPLPPLALDEWNLSAGGLDLRNDSHVGAAFAAASLIEMERAGLERANIYRAISEPTRPGDWGIVGPNGEHKPNWWVFQAFAQMRGERLAVEGDDPAGGLWTRAVRDGDVVHLVLATFRATGGSARAVAVSLDGPCAAPTAEHAVLDATSSALDTFTPLPVTAGRLALDLADQSMTWLRVHCRPQNYSTGLTGLEAGLTGASPSFLQFGVHSLNPVNPGGSVDDAPLVNPGD